eukprot:6874932-Alexandrium_andersonii.AAC.1
MPNTKFPPGTLPTGVEAPAGALLTAAQNGGGGSGLQFGIRWTPQEFVDCALQAPHPFDGLPDVPDDVARA